MFKLDLKLNIQFGASIQFGTMEVECKLSTISITNKNIEKSLNVHFMKKINKHVFVLKANYACFS